MTVVGYFLSTAGNKKPLLNSRKGFLWNYVPNYFNAFLKASVVANAVNSRSVKALSFRLGSSFTALARLAATPSAFPERAAATAAP